MILLKQYLNKKVDIEISGKLVRSGLMVDFGSDIMVIYDGVDFLYIPLVHLQHMKISLSKDGSQITPPTAENPIEDHNEMISYRKILNNAKGMFSAIYITGNQWIHGYLTSVMTDYFVFYSPVYHSLYISLNHLKCLIPYPSNQTPFSLDQQFFPVNPNPITLSRTFDQQLKKLEGKFTIFDLGENPHKIGLLNKLEDGFIELVTAKGEKLYWNIEHLKSFHMP